MSTYYTTDHEWITVNSDSCTIGITTHAADQMGAVVFIEQKEVGEVFSKGDEIGVVESVKSASDLIAPVDGEIIEVNEALAESPDSLNDSPEKDAWIYKVKIADDAQLADLMDLAAYSEMID